MAVVGTRPNAFQRAENPACRVLAIRGYELVHLMHLLPRTILVKSLSKSITLIVNIIRYAASASFIPFHIFVVRHSFVNL